MVFGLYSNLAAKTVNPQKGATTLIEMLVVIGIIAILTLIVVSNYGAGGSQLALSRSANKLSQDIRRAQEMAMSAAETDGSVPPRYGIGFDIANLTSYFLFVDNGSGKYEGSAQDKIIETINLEKNVKIDKIQVNGQDKSQAWITFAPPDPTTYIKDPGERSLVRIQLINNNKIKVIAVNKAGLIYVE